MKSMIYDPSTPEDVSFSTIRECKDCVSGSEVVFSWNFRQYGALKDGSRYYIALSGGEEETWCSTPDERLEYAAGSRLRDVVTQAAVTEPML